MNDVEKMLIVINHYCLTDLAKLVGVSIVSLSDIKTGKSNGYNVRWWVVSKIASFYNDDMKGC